MATKKTTTTKKQVLGIEETAEVLGITTEELMLSRGRGLEPGKLGYKKDGVLVWKRSDLPKPTKAEEKAEDSDNNGDE